MRNGVARWSARFKVFSAVVAALVASLFFSCSTGAQSSAAATAPVVSKVEPPNWWVGLTSDVMLLLSGSHLEVTHAECNLPTIKVMRTQSSGDGGYLFVWLRIGADTRSGTLVCRLTTPGG